MRKVEILIVGASSTVGRLLTPFWRESISPVLLQYRSPHSNMDPVNTIKWDPNEGQAALERWVSANETPCCMIILAGVTQRSGSDLFLNAQIVETYLETCKNLSIPRALVASSSAVYGDYLERPFSEDDAPCPINDYGKAKLAMEQACAHRSTQDLQVTLLRIGNVAGADALLTQALQVGSTDVEIDQYDDGGTPLRSYIGPRTLADTLIKLAVFSASLPEVLNVGSSAPVEMGALADAAGLPWRTKVATNPKSQKITLDCARLWGLIPEPVHASDPTDMVMQLNLPRA